MTGHSGYSPDSTTTSGTTSLSLMLAIKGHDSEQTLTNHLDRSCPSKDDKATFSERIAATLSYQPFEEQNYYDRGA